ncbi:MAG: AAA family ATPase, partial [Actinobacteria bacterium]|nr:AAA family ATPase [Actinomycetota bacterium]
MLDAPRELIGRDDELAILADFVAGVDRLPGALVLEGEAGIGKTALWAAGVEAAEAAGYTVLAARPAEVETKIAHTVLRDLLGPSFAEVSPQLPAPQRQALEAALLLSDVGVGADRGAIGVATLSVLRALASGRPVVVALDDAQWIDAPSTSALVFAVRRLDELPVALLLAVRSADLEADLPALVAALPDDRVRRARVGPLSLGALHSLIRQRLGMTFPRPVLGRLHKTSGGNPFYALELARALGRRGGSADLGSELPLPRSLRALVEERLFALPEETRELLVHAAALAQPSVALLEAALDTDAEAQLRPAVEAQVVEFDDTRIAFAHPLLASVLLSALSAPERRRVHNRLAEVVRDREARARHLALATDRPDVAVADALERAATLALSRGAPDAAAELLEQARRRTPPDCAEDRRRRIVRAAEFHLEAGATTRAEELLEEALARSPSGPLRAEALLRLSW